MYVFNNLIETLPNRGKTVQILFAEVVSKGTNTVTNACQEPQILVHMLDAHLSALVTQ